MYAARNLSFKFIVRFAWKPMLFFALYSALLTTLYSVVGLKFLAFPFVPISLVGTAVAFYVGFKNNSSYERLWEARKIWGSIVNQSRTLAVFILDYLKASETMDATALREHQQIMVHRHLAYINALRIQLRSTKVWEEKDDPFSQVIDTKLHFRNRNLLSEIKQFLHDDEADYLHAKTNTATHILRKQHDHLRYLSQQGCIDSFKEVAIGNMIAALYDQQGACERLKTYPFPRQYAYFSEVFVWLLALLVPFGLLGELSKFGDSFIWFTVPMSVLISWVFYVTEVVGDRSENPFENSVNDVPMTAICRTIEIDLREMLGEEDIPEKLKPVRNILM